MSVWVGPMRAVDPVLLCSLLVFQGMVNLPVELIIIMNFVCCVSTVNLNKPTTEICQRIHHLPNSILSNLPSFNIAS